MANELAGVLVRLLPALLASAVGLLGSLYRADGRSGREGSVTDKRAAFCGGAPSRRWEIAGTAALLLIAAQQQSQAADEGGAWFAFVRTAVMASIWIAYFAVSKRVRATFVN